jgi:hypothetical protein
LHGRAGDRAIRAEDATVAGLWAQQRVAACALMEVDAGIGWHGFDLPMSALWAGQFARQNDLSRHCAGPLPQYSEAPSAAAAPVMSASAENSLKAKRPRAHHTCLSATERPTELTLGSSVYWAKSQRAEQVMRRLTAIWAIWLSLLGVAMPVLACSMGNGEQGCCPVGTQSPCGAGSESQWNPTVDLCCSAGPTSANEPSFEPSRNIQSPLHPGTPDQFVVGGGTTANTDSAAAQSLFPSSIPSNRADAALTYLRTGRLRL